MGTEKTEIRTLEQGNIYFLYRPRLGKEAPEELSDIQRLYMVLSPEGKKRFRIAVIGRKKLPAPEAGGRDRYWGFIETVTGSPTAVKKEMGERSYRTKTRGERTEPAARPAGEGIYRLLAHGNHTHLVYALELPKQPGEAQEELGILDQASYIISVKNPAKGSPRQAGLSENRKAELPQSLQQIFGARRFADADPRLLDHPGVEFLLIAAAHDVQDELDITLDTDEETRYSADIFKELQLEKGGKVIKPLFEGKLV